MSGKKREGRENGREGRALSREGRDFEEGARGQGAETGDYRSMRDTDPYQVDRSEPYTEKYWRGNPSTNSAVMSNPSAYTDDEDVPLQYDRNERNNRNNKNNRKKS